MPTTYDDYEKYKYGFYDTLSDGLEYVEGSVHVYLVNDGDEQDITERFTTNAEGNTLNVTAEDVKGIPGLTAESEIVVRYQAKITNKVTAGDTGNANKVHLEFSNNPNAGGEGSVGTTPEDEVKVYTYELNIEKQNGKTKKALEGVGFKLYKDVEGTTLYAVIDETTNTIKEWTENIEDATEMLTDAAGNIKVKGLKAGKYFLKETKIPDGYNRMGDVTLEITEVLNGTEPGDVEQTLESFQLKSTVNEKGKDKTTTSEGDVATGVVKATILNFPGTLLPSTGGIGTIIFYVVGGLLIVGSVVLLIKNKKELTK